MARQWTMQAQRKGFGPAGFGVNIAEMPVRPQIDRGAVPVAAPTGGGGGQKWDAGWERRARKILGNKVGSQQDLMDPEHRRWINRKLRKRRQVSTNKPQKPNELVKPAKPAVPTEPATTPEVSTSPIVRPGHIVKRALQPRMRSKGTTGPRRGGKG